MEQVSRKRGEGAPAGGLTPAQLREAERGLKLMLARKFSAVWIAEHAKDVLGQANVEYTEWLERNPPARNPIGWLLTCAYRRALNLLDSQSRRPPQASIETVFHLADESTPTPEQVVLDNDRIGRLQDALSHLPQKERELLALVYFEGDSIREAGRKLGWRKSAADRHHGSAMKRMLALVGDRALLSPATLGPAAWIALQGERTRWAAGLDTQAAELGAHPVTEFVRRLVPFTEAGSTAAAGGGGRLLAQCGAVAGIAACSLFAGPALQSTVEAVGSAKGVDRVQPQAVEPTREATPVPPASANPAEQAGPSTRTGARSQAVRSSSEKADKRKLERRDAAPQIAPLATGSEATEEFGIEGGAAEPAPSSSTPAPSGGGSSSASGASPRPSPAPAPPASAASAEFGL